MKPITKYLLGLLLAIINPKITVNIGDSELIMLTLEATVYNNATF